MQDGWNYTHFVTPISTLERDRYRSQPTLPTSPLQMSPVIQSGESAHGATPTVRPCEGGHLIVTFCFSSGGSATSSPAMLGIRRHSSNYQRAQSSMQLDTYYGDNSLHKRQFTGPCARSPSGFFKTLIYAQTCYETEPKHSYLPNVVLCTSGSEKTPYFIGTYSSQSGEDLRRSQVRGFIHKQG